MKLISLLIPLALGVLMGSPAAQAQDYPQIRFNVIGGGSHNYTFRAVEQPFWNGSLPSASHGKVTAQLLGLSESGLKGPEIIRLMRFGAVDIGMGVFAFVAGDDATFEGIDLPGMAADIGRARRIADAYKPVLEQRMAERHGIKLLATVPYTAQVFFCRAPVQSLADLKGRKIRTRGRNMAELVKAIGAAPVTLPFAEVVTAMQTGVIDCAITGIGSGNAAKWYDVAGYLYDLPVDWSVGFYGIGLKRWQQLPPEVQQLLQAQSKVLEDALWQETARENRYAKACNVGSPDCQIHHLAHMSASAPDPQEQQRVRQMALEIANDWGRRCGPSCVEQWNASAGRAIGMRLAP
ncbi:MULTISPECIES: TRAP transporter substrate-binding protein [Pseudomonas]|uniref:Putative transport protein n=1 Tax=Pseudomonas putida TaxID=303 RepID=A0A1L7NFD1_PSEPU|nr:MULTISPECIES: TRAP transporter substrate-binding protein [Pseudomonas]MBP2082601.1 TRAP-type C4-dicarboxylate transport system substrate-binding protein [Pseudomonas sp. PvP089]MBP2091780.1 TRAP-type C4-dicarboxylate transport system substrate-binding protein [Pseudomonas sp. PvP088]MCE0780282.1 TRAP transporter substrate-binding protein [Pseudomonas sp. NMI542_15]PNB59249.1 C4-dicarboxylate ABC transporter [Pseudomonas sp. FW305-130]EKT4450620.1 TRAP transporter substrate-binding protein [